MTGLDSVRKKRTIVRIMRTTRHQCIDWLLPPVRKSVLTLLLMDARRRWHLRDIVRRAGCAVGSASRELRGLAECGIITTSRDGNRTYYQASSDCPIYPELVALIRKTSGLADVLRSALGPLAERIEVAFIYGSQARRQATSSSDVDLMVIGEVGFTDVVSALAETQTLLEREINPTVYTPEEFTEKARLGQHFVRSVLGSPKIILLGSAHELSRLAE